MGQGEKAVADTDTCLEKWNSMIVDMILLSYSDLVIAGQYSTFNQAMPMSMVYGRSSRKVQEPFCELHKDALDIFCFPSALEWCHKSRNRITLKTLNNGGGKWDHFMRTMQESPNYFRDKSLVPNIAPFFPSS